MLQAKYTSRLLPHIAKVHALAALHTLRQTPKAHTGQELLLGLGVQWMQKVPFSSAGLKAKFAV